MLDWTTNEWAITILTFLAGMFIGMFLLAGGKWKRRYRDQVKLREEIERDRDNHVARYAAANERIATLEKMQTTHVAPAPGVGAGTAAVGGAAVGAVAATKTRRGGGLLGRGKQDDFSRLRGIGPNGQERLGEMGIHRYKDLENLDDRRTAEVEGSLGLQPGHFEREGWREQARLLREGKDDEHGRLYPYHG